MPLRQQIIPIIFLFYNAPTRPVGIFDDFLAIQPGQGNLSTLSYPEYAISANSLIASTNTTRLVVIRNPGWKETNTIPNP